jgi:hypothetical protein
MPFNVNNIDGSVVANSVLGILNTLFTDSNYEDWLTKDLLKILIDSTSLLCFILDQNLLLSRPDIILVYYPPVKDFYWFVSRIVQLLQSTNLEKYKNDLETYQTLTQIVTKKKITTQIYQNKMIDEKHTFLYTNYLFLFI